MARAGKEGYSNMPLELHDRIVKVFFCALSKLFESELTGFENQIQVNDVLVSDASLEILKQEMAGPV